ncbi:glycosyltransferase [Alicyclobacillus kakegawensis]|uniref:glycosyltransferase n=1 Tax=Alicyclobacillus kakegawensis TaxID=392012 RepID=UPI000833D891|nr:glycosyltransferase [Alicyclobacillus kakegawensis]
MNQSRPDIPLATASAPLVTIIAAVRWDEVFARNQQMARGLALRGWDVLYVEPPVTWLAPLRRSSDRKHLRVTPQLRQIAVDARHTLRVLAPPTILPLGLRQRGLNRYNQRRLAAAIAKVQRRPDALISYLPAAADLVPILQPQAVIYDCADDHAAFPGTHNPTLVRQLEAELTRRSHSVFATARNLADRLSQWRADVQILPNAAEVEHFRRAETAEPHPLLRDIPHPRLGFIGGIGPWVDLAYIEALAALCPDCQLVLIGPALTDVKRLHRRPNVHLLGPQPYPDLPRFLAGFAATLFCFRASELTEGVNPVKVYEYIAAGREVIATPNRETGALARLLWLARTPDEAAAALRRILAGERRCTGSARESFLAANSWKQRVDVMEASLFARLASIHARKSSSQPPT